MAQFETALRQYLSKYKHPNEARIDILKTIAQFRDLRPSLDPFVFNDGTERHLVQLEGTIPVTYKGNTYNIPISIWVIDTHPYNPPMVFVKPTSTMQIKPGRYVDTNGKVDMSYIREWRHPTSDLLSLVQVLACAFGEECPVFSRGGGQRPFSGQTPYSPSNPAGNPPYQTQPNMAPAYPGGGGGYTGQGYPPFSNPPTGYPPSYPSYTSAYPPAGSYPGPTPGYPGPTGGYQQPPFGSQPPYLPSSMASTNGGSDMSRITPGGTVTEADIKASLLSAVEDKMKRRLRETFAQAQAEMEVLTKTQKDLTAGKVKIEVIITELEKEKADIEKSIEMLREKNNEVKEAIQKMESNQNLSIDDAVVTTTPLYRQLVDAFAEEQAIEDAIYYLGEALRKNVIELESFLKRVRELSRKQFMLRATIQKCREKAGLPPLA